MTSWNLKQIGGLYLAFLLIDLIVLIFRDLNIKLVWGIVTALFIIQTIYVFYLNHVRIKDNNLAGSHHLYLVSIMMCSLTFFFMFAYVLEAYGLKTILSG